jgi:hypothetical protein
MLTKSLSKTRFEILRSKIDKRSKEKCWRLPHLLLKKWSLELKRLSQDWLQQVRKLVTNKAVVEELLLC